MRVQSEETTPFQSIPYSTNYYQNIGGWCFWHIDHIFSKQTAVQVWHQYPFLPVVVHFIFTCHWTDKQKCSVAQKASIPEQRKCFGYVHASSGAFLQSSTTVTYDCIKRKVHQQEQMDGRSAVPTCPAPLPSRNTAQHPPAWSQPWCWLY